MGVADLRDAFTAGLGGAGVCSRAFLGYERQDGQEFQRLTFRGRWASGEAFEVHSELLDVGTDVVAEAKHVAARAAADRQGSPS